MLAGKRLRSFRNWKDGNQLWNSNWEEFLLFLFPSVECRDYHTGNKYKEWREKIKSSNKIPLNGKEYILFWDT